MDFFKKLFSKKDVTNKKTKSPEDHRRDAINKEKQIATKRKEPWVAVLDTQVNPDNIRNGFFELDWNEYFVLKLKQEGYGFDGDADEEIVDRWFRDLARNILDESGQDSARGAGYINVVPIEKGKAEVS
jgi:hypothetical protein